MAAAIRWIAIFFLVKSKLRELAGVFLKLGAIGFGGPAAHIAMMEDEVVRKKGWLSSAHFLDLVGATNLIPGPNSTEMTMHCGYERAGWRGLIVAGSAFILPAVAITALLAWLYSRYGQLPAVAPFISGIQAGVIAIILAAAIRLARKAAKSPVLIALGTLCLTAALTGVNEITALLACGLAGLLIHLVKNHRNASAALIPWLLAAPGNAEPVAGKLKLFFIFLKVGAVLYGSGYVLFAYLDAELVAAGYLSRSQLLDAIAVGQITPGPVLSTATFIGWQIAGWQGAVAATIGIFLPSFLFVAILNPLIPRMRRSAALSAFLDAVNIAAVAVIFAVTIEMGAEAITHWKNALIATMSLVIVFYFKKMNSAFIVIGAAALGYLLSFL